METIPLSTPTLNGREQDFVQQAFDTNWIAPLGPQVDAFEREVAAVVGMRHAAALSSGTAAIHLALRALGVGPGDIVFCSDMTFSASCNPIVYQQAVPVFIDSERDTWNMCPDALERAFVKYPQVKAVLVVHLYGTPAKMDAITALCAAHGVALLEDAAESLGSTFQGRHTGTFGKIGILSFNGNKIITTSGGGMLLCDDPERVEKVRFWATQARDKARHYQHSELGYNYRMSSICAAIGRGQLLTLQERVQQKTAIYNRYAEAFRNHPYIRMNPVAYPGTVANHWLSCITLEPGTPVPALAIMEALEKEAIETRPIWKPMSLQPFYAGCDYIGSGVGADIFSRGLCLPSDVKMTPAQQQRVCEQILSLF